MKKMIRLTYFTPTYNREKLLPNLYNSLQNQTNKDFIWLIVDDGSTDGTEKLVKSWIKENKIKIDYHKKENGGKNTAIDYSNKVCKTEFIACVDSDDTLTLDATEVLYQKFDLVSNRDSFIGLVGRRKLLNRKRSEEKEVWKNCEIYFYELAEKYNFYSDTFLIFKTDILKNFEFPKIPDEKFITESVLYQQFSYDYKMVTFEEELYEAEYMEDGYTQMGLNLFIKNPKGYLYSLKQNAFIAIKYKKSFKKKIGSLARYFSFKRAMKISKFKIDDYKINWFYMFCGFVASFLLNKEYKEAVKQYKKQKANT